MPGGGLGRRHLVHPAPGRGDDRGVEQRVVDAVHRDVRPGDEAAAPALLGVAGELVAVHGEVGAHAAHHAVERLRLRLLQHRVVAVEVGALGVPAGAGLRAVGVHHRHHPEVDVGREEIGLAGDVPDQVEQGVLARDLVAVLLGVEEDPERRRPPARRVHQVDGAPPGRRGLHRHGDRSFPVHAREELLHLGVGEGARQGAPVLRQPRGGCGSRGRREGHQERDENEAGAEARMG